MFKKNLIALALAALVAAPALAASFNLTITPQSSPPPPPPPPPSGGCSSITPPSGWTCVFNVVANFDNLPVGHLWVTADVANSLANGVQGASAFGPATNPPQPVAGSPDIIVSDGKTGNGLQVLADDGMCAYLNSDQSFGVNYTGPAFNVLHFEWDEMERPGFDLHSEGKIGILAGFWGNAGGTSSGGQTLFAQQNMFFMCQPNACSDPTVAYSANVLEVGDGGGTNGVVEESIWFPPPSIRLGTWHHYAMETALGPNGWYKEWIDGVLFNNYPPGAVSGTGAINQPGAGGPSSTDAISTTNTAIINSLATGRRMFAISPHFGGQPARDANGNILFNGPGPNGTGSGDCMRTNSFIVYDNIHVTAYNR